MKKLMSLIVLPLAPIVWVAVNLLDPKYSFADVIKGWVESYLDIK